MFIKTVIFALGCLTISTCMVFMNMHVDVRKRGLSELGFGENVQPNPEEMQANSATGELFSGRIVRTFAGAMKHGRSRTPSTTRAFQAPTCTKWSVVTTIYAATAAVRAAAAMPGWCTVIVGDRKTPQNYMRDWNATPGETVVFLSIAMQEREGRRRQDSVGAYMRHVSPNHFSRKNVGYLYAIAHGADYVFDFDDDNELKSSQTELLPWTGTHWNAQKVISNAPVLNVYAHINTTVNDAWPRGFPLELVKTRMHARICPNPQDIAVSGIGVVQFTADHDPDVDAVYRMTRTLPFYFQHSVDTPTSLVLPPNTYSPYNAQATLHTRRALWALLLPSTVAGRVSDIWRSFFAQNIFARLGLQLAFGRPCVTQHRNAHNYLADMQAESDIYFKAAQLIDFLSHWRDTSTTLPEAVESLWIALYERTYIEIDDVVAMQLWLSAVGDSGYIFPALQLAGTLPNSIPLASTTVLVQFNYNTNRRESERSANMWSKLCSLSNVILALPRSDPTVAGRIGGADEIRPNPGNPESLFRIVRYTGDKGFYSPLHNMIKVIRESTATTGVLYVHDDMLLSASLLSEIETTEDWIATIEPDTSVVPFQLLRNGTLTGPLPPTSWWWTTRCMSKFGELVRDPRLQRFWGTEMGLDLKVGPSDMLYVSTKNRTQMHDFTAILEIFAQDELFLECALPSAVAIMQQKHGVRVRLVQLCTAWNTSDRNNPDKWPCIQDKAYSAFHPVKPRIPNNRWAERFQQISLSDNSSSAECP